MTAPHSSFRERRAVLATMHGKEAAIAPAFEAALGLRIEVPEALDTDQFGTFSGEVKRAGSMEDALLAKAQYGLAQSGLDLAIASEGSFGPHPQIPFIAVGLEKLLLLDLSTNFTAMEQHIDTSPCYHSWETDCVDRIKSRLQSVGFPDQAMIARPNKSPGPVVKGIGDWDTLEAAVRLCSMQSADGLAFIQTDMRAFHNPRRMQAITILAGKMAQRLSLACPACAAPGWGLKRVSTGLPCAACAAPTGWVREEILGCFSCPAELPRPRSDGLQSADPAHCPYCNP